MKIYIKLSLLILSLFLIISCDKDDELLVFDSENGQTLIKLESNSATMPTLEGVETTAIIAISVSTQSSSDRVIVLDIDPTSTATPDQYTITGLSILAGAFNGTITISSNYDALPVTGSTFLKFSIANVGNSTLVENGEFRAEFFRKCPIVLANLVGTWSGTGSWSEVFGYTTEVVTTLDKDGNLWITGLTFQWFTGWWGEVIVVNTPVKVDIDVESEEIVISEQDYIESTWNGSPQTPYRIKATGRILNACEGTMEIFPVLLQGGSEYNGVNFGGPLFLETITID